MAGTDRSLRLAEIARIATGAATGFAAGRSDAGALPEELSGPLDETARAQGTGLTYPNGCHICELEVDPETGAVAVLRYVITDDFGKVVNPLLCRGQIHGGTVQGIGQALLERTVYEADSGQLLSGSFMDYALPRAGDLPAFEIDLIEDVPCATNPMGVKGAGEAGSIGAPPAVMNALVDALAPLGVRHIDMPATPERVWQAIRQAAALD